MFSLVCGNYFLSLGINATFCIQSMSLQQHIFIVTNCMSYSLFWTHIAIISWLWYWDIVVNFCNILQTHCVETCLFHTWGDIVTQYITVVLHHSSLIQETDKKWYYTMQGLFQQLCIYGDQSSSYILVLSSESVWL